MSSKTKTRFFESLTFRLAVLYASVTAIALIIILVVAYFGLRRALEATLDEHLIGEIEEYKAHFASRTILLFQDILVEEAASEGPDRTFSRVLNNDGSVVLETDMAAWTDVPVHPVALAAAEGDRITFVTLPPGPRNSETRVIYGKLDPSHILQIGRLKDDNDAVLAIYRRVSAIVAIPTILLSFGVGILMSRRTLSGVRRVTLAANSVASGDWESRVDPGTKHDEIAELATAFNTMIARVNDLIRGMRNITDDVAHDLKTPIARIRAAAEACLEQRDSSDETHDLAANVLQDSDTLLQLVNTMLEISQTEAGAIAMADDPVDLAELTADVCELFRPAAEDKGLELVFTASPELFVRGDAQRLARAIAHIVDNSIKYTESGGRVETVCERRNGMAVTTVKDSGPGIAEEDLPRIFDRFYRGDRSRSGAGNGLGLSVSRAICAAHGGVVVARNLPGGGSEFEISIPAIPGGSDYSGQNHGS